MIHKLLLITLLLFPPFIYAGNWPSEVDKMVDETKKSIKLIDIKEFKKIVDKPGGVLIIDVREPNEYYNGYVPGAFNIPRGLLEFRIWQHLGFPDKVNWDQPIYIYCQTTGRAALAVKSLTQLGLRNVTAVNMFIEDWEAAGYVLDF